MYLDPMKRRGRERGLTLIELAVAVTLITGAMSLLLPTFKDARERAKRMTCQSNLGQIAKGFLSYTTDRLFIPVGGDSDGYWAVWSYGGWSGTNRAYWESSLPDFNIQTRDRPLSVYMTAWQIPEEKDRFTPTQEMPLFKCPSDNISAQWQWGSYGGELCSDGPKSAYEDVGTSYQMNYHWWEQIDQEPCLPGESWPCLHYANEMFRKYIEQDPSRFITLIEDPLDWGFGNTFGDNPGIQVQGYHGEFSKHVVGFADGHVEYLYIDSRHEHDSLPNPPGPRHGKYENLGGWSVCDWKKDHPSGGRHL